MKANHTVITADGPPRRLATELDNFRAAVVATMNAPAAAAYRGLALSGAKLLRLNGVETAAAAERHGEGMYAELEFRSAGGTHTQELFVPAPALGGVRNLLYTLRDASSAGGSALTNFRMISSKIYRNDPPVSAVSEIPQTALPHLPLAGFSLHFRDAVAAVSIAGAGIALHHSDWKIAGTTGEALGNMGARPPIAVRQAAPQSDAPAKPYTFRVGGGFGDALGNMGVKRPQG